MPTQRYEAVNSRDEEDVDSSLTVHSRRDIPSSPPPSFHSRSSSPTNRRLLGQDPMTSEADQNLNDAFDDGEESDVENDGDDRQRLMRADGHNTALPTTNLNTTTISDASTTTPQVQRIVTVLPTAGAFPTGNAQRSTNDGVFANLAAKSERGEQVDEKPPTYEQAAADATPPYWETTILAPGMSGDEIYVDGLPVGQIWSFLWNAMISMSFQLVGFLLTYLLHTTHAAKNGSRAGLAMTLIQYGFYMKNNSQDTGNPGQFATTTPPDPNSHSFDPSAVDPSTEAANAGLGGISSNDWISYVLMIIGWFILIRSISDYMRARRHEALILQSPTRGLSVPILADGETPEQVA